MSQEPTECANSTAKDAILVVDDNTSVLELVARMLSRMGRTVIACSTPGEALDRLKENSVAVVVSDISMPEMSGFTLMRLVHERHPKLPVVLMTGDVQVNSATNAFEFGASAFLQKPFDGRFTSICSTVPAKGRRRELFHQRAYHRASGRDTWMDRRFFARSDN